MGILRADRITGLGGANAITGSCFFDVKNYLLISHDISLDGDFTIEWWTHRATGVTNSDWFTIGDAKESNGLELYIGSSGSSMVLYSNNGSILTANSGSPSHKAWHHIAVVRSSNTIKIYVDGTADSTTASNSSTFTGFIRLGAEFYNASATIRSKMHMSNFRIVKGTALYTSNFTPPNNRLDNITGTEVLCCQSPGNILQEATGKTIVAERAGSATTSSNVKASRFTPNSPVGFSTTTDVGSQYGTTFDGFGSFATSTYMVPPGGNTRERNRGRGLLMGGAVSPGATNTTQIKYFDIASQGITEDFGQTTSGRRAQGSVSSSTRACMGAGYSHGGSPGTVKNIIDYVTIATTGNALDFGDMQSSGYGYGTSSNQTRGLFAGGYRPNNSAVVNTIDLITIATTGNASNFGDLSVIRRALGGTGSTTRGVFTGGTYPAVHDVIDYVTFASTGNATDFGNLTDARDHAYGSSSSTRGVFAGGRDPNTTNIIDYITIASTGNAIDFGDLTHTDYFFNASTSNSIRAVWAGTSTISNTIEFVTIATLGNASDWGDQSGSAQHSGGNASDSHGGLE